jgi:hypothetical protein
MFEDEKIFRDDEKYFEERPLRCLLCHGLFDKNNSNASSGQFCSADCERRYYDA